MVATYLYAASSTPTGNNVIGHNKVMNEYAKKHSDTIQNWEELPEIDDDFVKDISDFDTLDEFKADLRSSLEKSAAAKAESQMKNSVIEKVFEANEIDIPDVMVESEIDSMMSEFDQQLRGQGMDLDTYFQYVGKTAEDFRKEVKEDAYKRVKTRMLISKIAEQENFEVSNDEINTELENMAKQYGLEADKLREMIGAENVGMIAGDIKIRKAVEFIYDNAVKK